MSAGDQQSGTFDMHMEWERVSSVTLDPMEIPQTVELTSLTAPEGALSAYGPGERPKLSLNEWRVRFRHQQPDGPGTDYGCLEYWWVTAQTLNHPHGNLSVNSTRERAMRQNVGNLMTSEIELRQHLSALVCEWLTGCLHAKNGVADVKWSDKTSQLFVEYNAATLESAELLDFLRVCGVPVASLRAGYA